jgi:16S rRNA (cytosine967-C5)-methyltransferase
VIRRHPDIKYLRRPEDITALTRIQGQILDALWGLLRPGGRLVYVTCSILPQENHVQLQQFLATHGDADEVRFDAPWGLAMPAGRQILNTGTVVASETLDGFFYATLTKRI